MYMLLNIPVRQHPVSVWILMMRFGDLMIQDTPTHWVLFLSPDVFVEYISIKKIYFYLKYYGLFLYSKQ